MTNQYYLVHPGEILQDSLDALGMSQVELSERIGLAKETINDIVRGRDKVTPDTAAKLSLAFGTSMDFWLNLQANYEVAKANAVADERAEKEAKEFGALEFYRELVKHGYAAKAADLTEKIKNLWSFFGVESLTYLPKVQAVAFRRKPTKSCTNLALAAWLRCGEKDAAKVEVELFDKEKLMKAISVIRPMTATRGDIRLAEVAAPLAKAGVVLVKTPVFKGLGVNAATRWLNSEKAMIQLSVRGQYSDRIWFSLFHEIGHLVKHGKKDEFVEFETNEEHEKENEADVFAADALIPRAEWREFINQPHHDLGSIISFAGKLNIDPGVVAGRYAHENDGRFKDVSRILRKVNIV
jgi:HTH-type transcriptional regulator/antitoxin HigA